MRASALMVWFFCSALGWSQPVELDEAGDRLRFSTEAYEITLSKANGAILGISDKKAPAALTLGSRNGCLWGSNLQTPPTTYRGGCNFAAGRADAFTYSWNNNDGTLALSYRSATASAQRVEATVTIAFGADSFDMKLVVTNQMGVTMTAVLFPSDLVFTDSSIQAAYFPYYLPGVRLKPGFFTANRNISATYPSARAFADYLALDVSGGSLSYYSVNPTANILPAVFGFQDDERTKAGTFYAFHTFQTWVPDGGTFETPLIRVRVGHSAEETITAYRIENGIADYPSLTGKLGDLASTLVSAPLVKMDFKSIGRSFSDLSTRLDLIRPPAILHPVSYWPRSFDQNYPDFLPPDLRFGTMADFRAFADAAHARGLLVMPYTNPTWWDEQSPSSRSVPDIAALAVISADGKPVYESYGPNRGFVASPHAPGVRDRIAALMAQWRDDVPVDFVFQDQIGSRSWIRDFNPAAPDPQSYYNTWLEYTRTYGAQRLMTEDGWDRLASTEIGFAGSLLTGTTTWNPKQIRWGQGSRGNQAFGAGLWEPYPLGVWLFHDKVLFYHHDLDDLPMNAGVEVLTWNTAFGVMGGYFWPELRSPNPDWAGIASAFQPAVWSRTAGRMFSAYRTIAADVTESRFDDISVIANWNPDAGYQVDSHSIAPSGCLARTDDGSVLAGVFADQFSGLPLSPGLHYLVIERSGQLITVWHPSGSDTSLTLELPADWDLTGGVQVRAMARGNQAIAPVSATLDDRRLTFLCARGTGPAPVDRYEITSTRSAISNSKP